jgi:hypothetical protein
LSDKLARIGGLEEENKLAQAGDRLVGAGVADGEVGRVTRH